MFYPYAHVPIVALSFLAVVLIPTYRSLSAYTARRRRSAPQIASTYWFSNSTVLDPKGITHLAFSTCAPPESASFRQETPTVLRVFKFNTNSPRADTKHLSEVSDLPGALSLKGKERAKTPTVERASTKPKVHFEYNRISPEHSSGEAQPEAGPSRPRPVAREPTPPIRDDTGSTSDANQHFVKSARTIRGTDLKTVWWEDVNKKYFDSPPDPSLIPKLKVGDLFCSRIFSADPPSRNMWLYTDMSTWMKVEAGYTREDERCLKLTKKYREPSWVLEVWFKKSGREADD
ncbi:hypothetical protein PHLGIDRAFT_131089 [Phlebiopsis gigantea 11061_1 CR5-6]|uniref:Uncharacterized protein n=1 Tax=Phlebiopsis gigantea (strain 11061_1 CR5-6) TaxID=745531 RepID=A0A0C3S2G2_PHLG1|nr:hypothetical protein PHLGIDRAFT_131089 [Phlebiopsis gigantea 11061_1 CR5-6]